MSGAFFIGFLTDFCRVARDEIAEKAKGNRSAASKGAGELLLNHYSPDSSSANTSGGIWLNQLLSLSLSLSTPNFFRDEKAST